MIDLKKKRYSFKGRLKYQVLFTLLLMVAGIFIFQRIKENHNFELTQRDIIFREIGHEILLSSGDSISRVLPVKQANRNEYQMTFDQEFSFQPDSLVEIIKRSLVKTNLTQRYIVSVYNCGKPDIFFGYAILGDQIDNIIPCSGRVQPKSCYQINVKFQNTVWTSPAKNYIIAGVSLLGLLVFFNIKKVRTYSLFQNSKKTDSILLIGNTGFDFEKRCLQFGKVTTDLTTKESMILEIFARSPDIVIERSKLQKEIWEDEGVIVGRSLDMFISKLRKKLSDDKSLQIVNIHGKGYKLEIKRNVL